MHPGLIDTDLARSWMRNGCPRPLQRVVHPLLDAMFPFILLPPRHAAATLLWAASAPHSTVSLHDAGHDAWKLSGSLPAACLLVADTVKSEFVCDASASAMFADVFWAANLLSARCVCMLLELIAFALWPTAFYQVRLPNQQTPAAWGVHSHDTGHEA